MHQALVHFFCLLCLSIFHEKIQIVREAIKGYMLFCARIMCLLCAWCWHIIIIIIIIIIVVVVVIPYNQKIHLPVCLSYCRGRQYYSGMFVDASVPM